MIILAAGYDDSLAVSHSIMCRTPSRKSPSMNLNKLSVLLAIVIAASFAGAVMAPNSVRPGVTKMVKPDYPQPIPLPDGLPETVLQTNLRKPGPCGIPRPVSAAHAYRTQFQKGWDEEWERHCDDLAELREHQSPSERLKQLKSFLLHDNPVAEAQRIRAVKQEVRMDFRRAATFDDLQISHAEADGSKALRKYLGLSGK